MDVNRWHRVATDPGQHAHLLDKEREIGTVRLVDYAHSLGLYPPGYPDVDCAISVAWPSDAVENTDMEPEAEQAEDGDDDNPWEGIVPITDARSGE